MLCPEVRESEMPGVLPMVRDCILHIELCIGKGERINFRKVRELLLVFCRCILIPFTIPFLVLAVLVDIVTKDEIIDLADTAECLANESELTGIRIRTVTIRLYVRRISIRLYCKTEDLYMKNRNKKHNSSHRF